LLLNLAEKYKNGYSKKEKLTDCNGIQR